MLQGVYSLNFNSADINEWKEFCLWQTNINHSLAQMCGELINELMRYRNTEEKERYLRKLMKGGEWYDGERV